MFFERCLNSLWIFILTTVVLLATAYQIAYHELPCPLCLLQRVGMFLVALGPLWNIWYGFKVSHYGFSLFSAIFGGSVSLRQILLHICPQFSTFGTPVLGLELYTWAFLVFVSSVAGCALILCTSSQKYKEYARPSRLELAVSLYYVSVVSVNCFLLFLECGFNFCIDDPTHYLY